VISQVFRATLEEVDDLPATQRQGGGFGHTGI
jgi:dUTPase